MTIVTVLLLIALGCFVAAALGVGTGPVNLTAAGLAFWVASQLASGFK